MTLEGGIFNGSGLPDKKNFWTGNYNFSFKAQTFIARDFNVALSCQKATYSDSTRGKATAVSEQNKIVVEFVAHF